jgi:ribonuclease HII
MQSSIIAGVDEAGRGALAGPVVAGACVIPCPLFRRRSSAPLWSPFRRIPKEGDCLIADSKQLTPEERAQAYSWITANCAWGVGIADADVIECYGIVPATKRAMDLAIAELQSKIALAELLIDGRDAFRFTIPHRSIIRGDSLEPCIAAGSIIAKVTRDRLMTDLCDVYPNYRFSIHKGYGTTEHIEQIKIHGPSQIHRKSFLTRIIPELVQPSLSLF